MSVHLSQDVVSATIVHLLLCQNGSRFNFSHEFCNSLDGQMLNELNGEELKDFGLQRKNRDEIGDVVMWPDYSVNDYTYRPDFLDGISFYEFAATYERVQCLSRE